jgi:pimeloyl-ACP methyl ester carboxylesterase
MHVERYGYGGEPIVLLHGFATSAFLWREIGPMLAVRGMSVYALDMFGYGESDRPFDADFGIQAQASYLDAAMTALQLPVASVAGVDIGAVVALRLAIDRPERVRKVALIGLPPLEDLPGSEIRELQRDTARYALRLSRGLFGASALLTPFLDDSVALAESMPPALIGRYLAPYLGREGANHLVALAGALEAADAEDLEPQDLRQETLLVRGAGDAWCTRAWAEEFAARLPRGRLEHMEGMKRLVPEDAPADFAALLSAFVRPHETERPGRGTFPGNGA